MRISIIIPTKNRPEDLVITLHSLMQQSISPDEVIIVDQSQESCEEEVLKLFRQAGDKSELIYIRDENIPGPVQARAVGLDRSNGEIVFFLDDDITLEKNCIENLLQRYDENPHLGGIGGVDTRYAEKSFLLLLAKTVFTCGPFSEKKGGWFFTGWVPHYFHNKLTKPHSSRWLLGGIMSFRRHILEKIGFDKQLKEHVFMGDMDLAFRVSEKYNLAIDPRVKGYEREALVAHYNMKEDYEKRISGNWYFFIKNIKKTPLNILFFAWNHLGLLLGAIVAATFCGSLDPLRGYLAGIKIGATRYRRTLSARRNLK